MDPLPIAQALVRCPSVTPADAGAIPCLEKLLGELGFTLTRLTRGGPPDGPVENLFATIGTGGPHFAFAGHTDVVPAGDGWRVPPFDAVVEKDVLIGRGAADMKGALAAMVSAAAAHVARKVPGTLSLIITGDEEGPAQFGTVRMLEWMDEQGIRPDCCVVGEPTSVEKLGDMMKIGRRGSLNAWIDVPGVQGHVAYPHRADNPIPRLLAILNDLCARKLDEGNTWFPPSNLEMTDIMVGNPATNVIPGKATARLNIRFNDAHQGPDLAGWIRETVRRHAPDASVEVKISGEAFLTEPGALSTLVSDAVHAETGLRPELSTTGGTSDARFIRRLCPVVEFGLLGGTIHKVDEQAAVADIRALARIYDRMLQNFFATSAPDRP